MLGRRTIEGVGVLKSSSIKGDVQTAEFEFEDSASISQYAMLADISLEPMVLVENSFFGNNRARGTLIKTSNVSVMLPPTLMSDEIQLLLVCLNWHDWCDGGAGSGTQ
jgi:hypothetical protein